MTDNFDLIWNYMQDLGIVNNPEAALKTDLFFDIQLIRRGKDHPNMAAANYTFKAYYFDNLEAFDKAVDEIKKCCDMFKLRAYVSVNLKSKQEATKKTLERYAHNVVIGEFRKPWKDFSSVCGGLEGKEKRWIVDIDDCKLEDKVLDVVTRIINSCDSSYNEDNVVCYIPTRSGVHVITHPFNLKQFYDVCDSKSLSRFDVKKNHITLLYENF